MRKELSITRIRAGLYYLKFKGIIYAVCIKDADSDIWYYMDSDAEYYFDTLSECKDHFNRIDFENGVMHPITFEPNWSYWYN